MKNIAPIQKQAIEAAKTQEWELAVKLNQEILEENPSQLSALNRLSLAFIQLHEFQQAKKILDKVLDIDKNNKIALRNKTVLNNRKKGTIFTFSNNHSYIEEPGKAKIVNLIRLANQKSLSNLSPCQECLLEPKKSFISVITAQNQYIGTLPQDISQRLIKLINNGNQYQCVIYSVEPSSGLCKVHLKESQVSEKNQGYTSFPISSIQTNYQDPELLSIEHELKHDIPPDYFNGEDDELESKDLDREKGEINDEISPEDEED